MNGSALHQTAADCAEELPGAQLEHPFGPAWEVYKVRGKVFMLMTEVPGRPVVILKADPSEAHALREQYRHISAGLVTKAVLTPKKRAPVPPLKTSPRCALSVNTNRASGAIATSPSKPAIDTSVPLLSMR